MFNEDSTRLLDTMWFDEQQLDKKTPQGPFMYAGLIIQIVTNTWNRIQSLLHSYFTKYTKSLQNKLRPLKNFFSVAKAESSLGKGVRLPLPVTTSRVC